MGNSHITGNQTVTFTDNLSFDGTDRGGALDTNGQLWIGATASDRANDGGHVRKGAITSPDSSITIGYSAPNITAVVNRAVVQDFHDTRYIVSAGGAADGANYTTITSALAAATAAGGAQTIFIQPGTYTENLTPTTSITFAALSSGFRDGQNYVTIIGKVTVSSAINVGFYGINLTTNSDNSIVLSGNGATVRCQNCLFTASSANSIIATGNSSTNMYIENCGAIISATYTLFTATSCLMWLKNCFIYDVNAAGVASTTSANRINCMNCSLNLTLATTGSGIIEASGCQFGSLVTPYTDRTYITTAGTGSALIENCQIFSGTASAISVGSGTTVECSSSVINSSNTNAVTGAGTYKASNVSYVGTSKLVNTTTQTPQTRSNDAVSVKAPGAYPYTAVPQDNVIIVDTSSARGITLNASPVTGQMYRIKDNVGSAAANNITITPAAGNIDGSGTFVINLAYGSVDLVYNGTQWNAL